MKESKTLPVLCRECRNCKGPYKNAFNTCDIVHKDCALVVGTEKCSFDEKNTFEKNVIRAGVETLADLTRFCYSVSHIDRTVHCESIEQFKSIIDDYKKSHPFIQEGLKQSFENTASLIKGNCLDCHFCYRGESDTLYCAHYENFLGCADLLCTFTEYKGMQSTYNQGRLYKATCAECVDIDIDDDICNFKNV